MPARIQLVIDERERDAFRRRAEAEGRTLSEWLREAGRERLARSQPDTLGTAGDLARFFADCDTAEVEGREPDWETHLAIIQESRREGVPHP